MTREKTVEGAMGDERYGEHEVSNASDASKAAQRQAALRALAQEGSQATKGAPTTGAATFATRISAPLRSVTRRVVSALTVLVVVVVVGVVIANIVGGMRPAAPAAKTSLRLNLLADGLSCVSQVAWSPDGKQIAALGDTTSCGGYSTPQTGTVTLYDARSGKIVRTLQPDNIIFKDPAVTDAIDAIEGANNSAGVTLDYEPFAWAPNGQSLLMPFAVDIMPPEGQSGASKQAPGLLRLGVAQSSKATIWLDSVLYLQSGKAKRWDLTTGTSALVPAPPAATTYQWNSDGTLSPADATASLPVGTPDGGKSFTIWQPGFLQFAVFQQNPTQPPAPDTRDTQWGAIISPVSPDGRYFYSYFPANGSLVPPSTHQAFPQEAILTPHDKAMQALAQQLAQTPNQTPNAQMLLAWRPDGRLLAELTANATAPVPASAFTVSLYDTTTGKLVKRLTPDFTGLQSGPAGIEALAWSPDGARLLLMDNVYGAITIWGPSALPA